MANSPESCGSFQKDLDKLEIGRKELPEVQQKKLQGPAPRGENNAMDQDRLGPDLLGSSSVEKGLRIGMDNKPLAEKANGILD